MRGYPKIKLYTVYCILFPSQNEKRKYHDTFWMVKPTNSSHQNGLNHTSLRCPQNSVTDFTPWIWIVHVDKPKNMQPYHLGSTPKHPQKHPQNSLQTPPSIANSSLWEMLILVVITDIYDYLYCAFRHHPALTHPIASAPQPNRNRKLPVWSDNSCSTPTEFLQFAVCSCIFAPQFFANLSWKFTYNALIEATASRWFALPSTGLSSSNNRPRDETMELTVQLIESKSAPTRSAKFGTS